MIEKLRNTIITSKRWYDIEKVAEDDPNSIFKVKLSPGTKLLNHHARTAILELGLKGTIAKSSKNLMGIYNAFEN